jgi:hypothetical protein
MTGTRSRRASSAAAYMTCDVEMKLMKLVHSLLLAQLKPRLGMRHLAMLVRTSVAISSQQAERSASLAIGPKDLTRKLHEHSALSEFRLKLVERCGDEKGRQRC